MKTVRAARWSAFWALSFIGVLYLTAPATAAFARYYMIQSLHGKSEQELPRWFNNWEKTGLIVWLDDGDGSLEYYGPQDPQKFSQNEVFRRGQLAVSRFAQIRAEHQQWIDTGGAEGEDGRQVMRELQLAGPDRDIIVLATPEMAELANWIIALVAAGGLAAALSTASGLLLVISSSVAHDLYYRVLNPAASEARRLRVGRTVIGFAVVIAGLFGIFPPGFVSQVVAFAFGLAAASFFRLSCWGFFQTSGNGPGYGGDDRGDQLYRLLHHWKRLWRNVQLVLWDRPAGYRYGGYAAQFCHYGWADTVFPSPSTQVQDLIENLREPEGAGPAVIIETAPEH